jgi:hypothetical protein
MTAEELEPLLRCPRTCDGAVRTLAGNPETHTRWRERGRDLDGDPTLEPVARLVRSQRPWGSLEGAGPRGM